MLTYLSIIVNLCILSLIYFLNRVSHEIQLSILILCIFLKRSVLLKVDRHETVNMLC